MEKQNGLAVASFVIGLVSIPMMFLPCCNLFASIGLLMAVVFGVIGLKSDNRGLAIAGLITGLVGIALYVVVILVIGVSFMSV